MSVLAFIFYFLISMQGAVMAVVFSAYSLWLKKIGLAHSEITVLVSTEALMRPVGFALALWLSLSSERKVLKLASWALAGVFLVSLFFLNVTNYAILILLSVVVFSGYWMLVPLIETAGMRVAMVSGVEFGRIIMPGSVVFFVVLLFGGWGFEKFGLNTYPVVLSFLLGLQWCGFFAYTLQRLRGRAFKNNAYKKGESKALGVKNKFHTTIATEGKNPSSTKHELYPGGLFRKIVGFVVGIVGMLRENKLLLALMLCSMFVFSAISAHGAYSSLMWSDNGWGTKKIGMLWAMGLVGEIFMLTVYASSKKSNMQLMRFAYISISITILRLVGTGYFVNHFTIQMLMQALHPFSFASMHLVVVALIGRYAKKENFERWQSLYFLLALGGVPAIVIGIAGRAYLEFGAKYYYGLAGFVLLGLPAFLLLGRFLKMASVSSSKT